MTNGGYKIMERVPMTDKSLQTRVSALEAENEKLYQIIEQLNATLQKVISAYIQPDSQEEAKMQDYTE